MKRTNNPLGGGIAIAVLAIVGALWGGSRGQPSAGLLIGVATGALLAGLVWLLDRRR